jgi:hypothetical protein
MTSKVPKQQMLSVRYSAQQWVELQLRAQLCGCNVSEYVRRATLGKVGFDVPAKAPESEHQSN